MKNISASLLLVLLFAVTSDIAKAQYCIPQISSLGCNCPTTWDNINNFWTTGGITNISNLETDCGGPNNFTYYQNQTVTALPNQSFQIHVQCGNNTTGCTNQFAQGFRIWVDWNNDLDYTDPGEEVWNSGTPGFQVFTGTITVPGFVTGMVRMRVRCSFAGLPPTTPCGSTSYGEVEEYNIMTTPPTPCSGAPTAGGTAQSTASSVTSSSVFTLSTPLPPTFAGGIEYQWQMNDGSGWQALDSTATNPLLSATNANWSSTDVTGLQTDAQFRLIVTCTNSGLADTSLPVTVHYGITTSCNAAVTYGVTGTQYGIQFNANTNGVGGVYVWDFGDGSPASTLENPQHNYSSTGTYIACVVYTYTDSAGTCSDTACASVVIEAQGIISGTVYNDANNNSMIDAGEAAVAGVTVYLNSFGSISTTTDVNGNYSFSVPAGNYYVTATPPMYHAQTLPVNNISYTANISGNDTLGNFDFGFSMTVAVIQGTVFFDGNQNGTQDNDEPGLPGQKILYPYGNWNNYVFTDTGGHYSLIVDSGTYNVSYYLNQLQGAWSVTTGGNTHIVSVDSTGNIYGGYDFGIYVDSNYHNAGLSLWCGTPVPGFNDATQVNVYNTGIFADSVVVVIHYDSLLVFVPDSSVFWWGWWNNANIMPLSMDSVNHTVTYGLVVNPGQTEAIYAGFKCPVGTPVGTSVALSASVSIVGNADADSTDDNVTCQTLVLASFDPNDKQVEPAGIGENHVINPDNVQTLTYKIRFQNTGTYHATNVVVEDLLDLSKFDISTLSFVSSSHPCVMEVVDGNLLKAHFNGIMLPDSNANEPASHGFVSFRIGLVDGLPNGTVVSNSAAIFFDYNEPVITEPAFVTLDNSVSSKEILLTADVDLFPNPVDQHFTLHINGNSNATSYIITDLTGRKLTAGQTNPDGATTISTSGLLNGMYCVTLLNPDNISITRRFTVLHK